MRTGTKSVLQFQTAGRRRWRRLFSRTTTRSTDRYGGRLRSRRGLLQEVGAGDRVDYGGKGTVAGDGDAQVARGHRAARCSSQATRAPWNAQDFEDRGGASIRRRRPSSSSRGPASTARSTSRGRARRSGSKADRARFQVSDNGAWCVGPCPIARRTGTRYLAGQFPRTTTTTTMRKRLPPNEPHRTDALPRQRASREGPA